MSSFCAPDASASNPYGAYYSERTNETKPGIYIESKGAPGYRLHGKRHLYLVYRRADGTEEVVRGGPALNQPVKKTGDIAVQSGVPLQDSNDSYGAGETPESRGARRLDLGDADPEIVWRQMAAAADQV